MTDDDRAASQLGPVPELHAGEERVHVDVQDAAAGVVRGTLRGFLGAGCVALGAVRAAMVSRRWARTAHVSPASEYLRAALGGPRSCQPAADCHPTVAPGSDRPPRRDGGGSPRAGRSLSGAGAV